MALRMCGRYIYKRLFHVSIALEPNFSPNFQHYFLRVALFHGKTNSKVNEKLSFNSLCVWVKVKRKGFLLCLYFCCWLCQKVVLGDWHVFVCADGFISSWVLLFIVAAAAALRHLCGSVCGAFSKHDVTVLSFGWHMHNNKQRFYLFKWHFSFIK